MGSSNDPIRPRYAHRITPMASRRSESWPVLFSPEAVVVFSELLAADERARSSGQPPLLTQAGLRFVLRISLAARASVAESAGPAATSGKANGRSCLPCWDAEERRLWLGDVLLKEFRQPAPNQTALLSAFEAHGWVSRHVMNPLGRSAGESESDAKVRL